MPVGKPVSAHSLVPNLPRLQRWHCSPKIGQKIANKRQDHFLAGIVE